MPAYYTAYDAVYHLLDFLGGGQVPEPETLRRAFRSVQAAYRDLAVAHPWSYYLREDRLALSATYTTGTAAYDHTGGTSERLITGAGGADFSSPAAAGYRHIILGGVTYEIEDYVDSTKLTLTETSNPGQDVSATTYTLFRDSYALPMDFIAADYFYLTTRTEGMKYVRPQDLILKRKDSDVSGEPQEYTILGDRDTLGRMMVRVVPYPTSAGNLDFMYHRQPRELRIFEYHLGTIATTSGSATITGTSTNWSSTADGTVLRIAATGTAYPEAGTAIDTRFYERMVYTNRYVYERRVSTRTSATEITTDSTIPETLSGVNYLLSDPIDIDLAVMRTAFERCAEYHFSVQCRLQSANQAWQQYQQALQQAIQADQRNLATRTQVEQGTEYLRREDLPIQPNRGNAS